MQKSLDFGTESAECKNYKILNKRVKEDIINYKEELLRLKGVKN